MLRLNNISKSFKEKTIFHSLSLKVNLKDFVMIMGPNGTGKSTLFHLISGKTFPDEGSIFFNSTDITNLSMKTRSSFIGHLFQNTSLSTSGELSVRDNFSLVSLKSRRATLRHKDSLFSEDELTKFFSQFSFDGFSWKTLLDKPMKVLSGGQRQMLSFMMTVLQNPKILLLDEPTAALDPKSSSELLCCIEMFVEKYHVPTLLITHDPLIAKHVGTRLWILENGGLKQEFGKEKKDIPTESLFQKSISL